MSASLTDTRFARRMYREKAVRDAIKAIREDRSPNGSAVEVDGVVYQIVSTREPTPPQPPPPSATPEAEKPNS